MDQPGYDVMANLYAETFPSPYLTPLERQVIAAFADLVHDSPGEGAVLDVGCGPGDVAADLASKGLDVLGIDPSVAMLGIARRSYPHLRFVHGDAHLAGDELAGVTVRAILARFSLIHVPPAEVTAVLHHWSALVAPGVLVAVAGQTTDAVGEVIEFDHAVAPAWLWHPDRLAAALADAGFDEVWRTISRPDANHRFPEVHLVARRR
ncbi:class I SAM-dependent methyltransferase [Rhodococcus sp. AG1013]|uniref:class I SAM-dependent methyltransferase n=1 Tax=unclassified Rhodococcus (in: high G+C Gram-positive bacteria) TaxID=192944 RepID=UPI000E0B8891|nr:class I SAM-dependent methyltransferase [Rhodococcus sp. AG1013]RDI16737.1 methyltransferase family protein [Rhodococcus sp. AG1013]